MREAGVDRVPGEHPLPRARDHPQADERLPCVDPHTKPQRRVTHGLEVLGAFCDPESRADRPLGVIFMCGGHSEDAHHGIADELLNHPSVRRDLGARHLRVRGEHLVDVLRIRGLGRPR